MNRILYVFVCVVVLCSCSSKDKYAINGVVKADEFQNQMVYMLDFNNGKATLDSARVQDGKFHFEGAQPVPAVRILRLQGSDSMFPVLLPIVLENSDIDVTLGNIVLVEGTEQNDKMQDFLMAISHFTDQDFSQVTTEEMQKQFQEIIISQILINKDNEVGVYIYKTYSPKLTEEQKSDLLSKVGRTFADKVIR